VACMPPSMLLSLIRRLVTVNSGQSRPFADDAAAPLSRIDAQNDQYKHCAPGAVGLCKGKLGARFVFVLVLGSTWGQIELAQTSTSITLSKIFSPFFPKSVGGGR